MNVCPHTSEALAGVWKPVKEAACLGDLRTSVHCRSTRNHPGEYYSWHLAAREQHGYVGLEPTDAVQCPFRIPLEGFWVAVGMVTTIYRAS